MIDTKKEGSAWWEWLDKIPAFDSVDAIDAGRLADGLSIALLRPNRLLGLDITKARHQEWTEEEKEKLMREQMQGDLFSEAEAKRQVKELRKVPLDFHYWYVCDTPEGEKEHKVNGDAEMLYQRCNK